MIDHTTSKVQAALSYAALGWRVFPLKPLSKEPLLHESWPKIATTNEQTIRFWWTINPDANIAIVADAHLCVIDIDRKDGKADGWASIGHLVDQQTLWCSTPNHGYHFYYRSPGVLLQGEPGVDIQQGNHYVVAPPSSLPEGNYTWGVPFSDNVDATKDVPFELIARLHKVDVPRGTSLADQPDDLPTLTDQYPSWASLWSRLKPCHTWFLHDGTLFEFPTRSELCYSLIRRLYRIGLQDDQLLSLLWSNPHVQSAYLDKRQDDSAKALKLAWQECRKLRHLRRPSVEEVFQGPPLGQPTEDPPSYPRLRDEALRLAVGEDIHPFLQQVAAAHLGPIERDLILDILKSKGYAKAPLQKQLVQYEREVEVFQSQKDIRWKHTAGEEGRPRHTVENLEILLKAKGASIRHNQMDHRLYLQYEGQPDVYEDKFNIQLAVARSWAAEYGMPLESIPEQLTVLAHRNSYHPFKEFVERHPWDGINRVHRVMDTVGVPEGKERLKKVLMEKWLISIVAAVYGYANRAPRGVLTFVGRQQAGKTTWLEYLVPRGMYHEGLLLNAGDRDSATKGLRYLLCELGEVGSTFRKSDIEALKSYIGRSEDVWRMSYERAEVIWPRKTIFAASTNNTQLLQDMTGNTRWWVLPVEKFDLDSMEAWWAGGEGYELQQFWAEVYLMYRRGDAWDLTDEDLAYLSGHQESHMEETSVISAIKDTYQWEETIPRKGYPVPKRMVDVARDIGLNRPFLPSEIQEARAVLQRLTGQREGGLRRLNLATLDGRQVSKEWKDTIRDSQRKGSTQPGRWWYVPHKVGEHVDEG